MHYKKRVREERPNALIRKRPYQGRTLHTVIDGDEVLELDTQNWGPKGAWRDAYFYLLRKKHARVLAHEARRK